MHIVHVFVHVKPNWIGAFQTATLENARNSMQEPGIARFDIVQQQEDPARFSLANKRASVLSFTTWDPTNV